jgi:hypothetical protein
VTQSTSTHKALKYSSHIGLCAAWFLTAPFALAQTPSPGDEPLLPLAATTTTIPANGDLNPYGVVFVPPDAANWKNSKLKPGDILVSNFNASSNQQGTGTTIIQYSPSDRVFPPPSGSPPTGGADVFFQESTAPGLTLALGVLKRGAILVGAVSAVGPDHTPTGGPLFVVAPDGALVQAIPPNPSTKINGPWGLAVADNSDSASIFVSNVLDGTVTRLDVTVRPSGKLDILWATTIAAGYGFGLDPAAFVVGPAGLAYEEQSDTLYVASEVDNAIFKIAYATKRTSAANKGVPFASGGNLRSPLGLAFAPNGHLIVTNADVKNADPNHPSEILEFTHDGVFLRETNVNESQGAAFGVALGQLVVGHRGSLLGLAAVNDVSNDVTVRIVP